MPVLPAQCRQLVLAAALMSLGGVLLGLVFLSDEGFYPITGELALFGSGMVVGTLCLVVGGRWPRLLLGKLAWTAVGVGAIGATLLSYYVVEVYGCCLLVVHRLHGYPFPWLDGHHRFPDWLPVDRALGFMDRHPDQVTDAFSAVRFLGDLLFWAYVLIGFALVGKVILRVVRRRRSWSGRPAPRVASLSPGRR